MRILMLQPSARDDVAGVSERLDDGVVGVAFVAVLFQHALAFEARRGFCQNAVGMTKGTIGGLLLADKAVGVNNPLIADIEAVSGPAWIPPRPALDIGVRTRFAFELWRSRAED